MTSIDDLELMLARLAIEAEKVGKLFERHKYCCDSPETCMSTTARSYRDALEAQEKEQREIMDELRPGLSKTYPRRSGSWELPGSE